MPRGVRGRRKINGKYYIDYGGGNKQVAERLAEDFRKLRRKVRIIQTTHGYRVYVSGKFIEGWWNKVRV